MAKIISLNCERPSRDWVNVFCPWCGRPVRIGTRETVECRCGALHRWAKNTLYHIPSLRKQP